MNEGKKKKLSRFLVTTRFSCSQFFFFQPHLTSPDKEKKKKLKLKQYYNEVNKNRSMFLSRSVGVNALTRPQRLFGQIGTKVRFNSTKSESLNWVEYFNLKKQNNRINMVSSVFTGIIGGTLTLGYLGNIEIDVEKPIMGFDPFMVMGGAVILGGGFGYLLGPFLGTSVFNLLNRSKLNQFNIKHKVFLQKIQIKRVDPSTQSFSNPVPDYYGERIYSLKDYRQWLRDCNGFRRKSKEFL